MTDPPIAASSFCVVPGCSDHATRSRIVVTGPETTATVDVCEKHADEELDINQLDLGNWGE